MPEQAITTTQVDIQCDYARKLVAVVFPGNKRLFYTIQEDGPVITPRFLSRQSANIRGVDGNNPDLRRLAGECYLKLQSGQEGIIRWDFGKYVQRMPDGTRVVAPELEGLERAIIQILITLDDDGDNVVFANMAEVNARAELLMRIAGGTVGEVTERG